MSVSVHLLLRASSRTASSVTRETANGDFENVFQIVPNYDQVNHSQPNASLIPRLWIAV